MDMRMYFPEVVQVLPRDGFRVIVYFSDGKIVEKDMSASMGGAVFRAIRDPEAFAGSCCVANGTLAWDPAGERDPAKVIDLDPLELYGLPAVNGLWANAG